MRGCPSGKTTKVKFTALFRHAPIKFLPSPSLKEIKKELQNT